MVTDREARKALEGLIKSIIQGGSTTSSLESWTPSIRRRVPTDLFEGIPEDQRFYGLTLTGNEVYKFRDTWAVIRGYLPAEALSDEELNDKLWRLVCRAVLDKKRLRMLRGSINALASDVLKEMASPIVEYEFIFGLDVPPDTNLSRFEILGVRIESLSRNDIGGVKADRDRVAMFAPELGDFMAARVVEKGADSLMAQVRARTRVLAALDAVAYIASFSLVLHDWQMAYRLGRYCFCLMCDGRLKAMGLEPPPWSGRGSIPTVADEPFGSAFQVVLTSAGLPLDVQESLRIGLRWYNRSIMAQDIDEKVIFICTALEAILTSRSDKRKGENLAFRAVAVMFQQGQPSFEPERILEIYELRSYLVHGSRIGIAKEDDYGHMRWSCRNAIASFVGFADANREATKSRLLALLDSSNGADGARRWLQQRAATSELAQRILDEVGSKEI